MKASQWGVRLAVGGLLGAALVPVLVYFLGSFFISLGVQTTGYIPAPVVPAMVKAFGSQTLAIVVQSLLGGLFGAVVAVSTLPFADQGRSLVVSSLCHFGATALTFALILWVCRWVKQPGLIAMYVGLLGLLYLLIWLGRWVGWYAEVAQLRALLGLAPGPSALHWRETLPYVPFALLACTLMPVGLFWIDRTFAELPVLSGLISPFVLLPVAGFFSGLSLGKRQGICPLYPVVCFLCYLPLVFLLFNSSALFHCYMVAIPALVGNVMGWFYRRAVPKKKV